MNILITLQRFPTCPLKSPIPNTSSPTLCRSHSLLKSSLKCSFSAAVLPLCGLYTHLILDTSSSSHHSVTPPSDLHNLYAQLLLHHTPCNINILRPPQLVSSTLYAQKPHSLSSLPYFLQISILLFLSSSHNSVPLPLILPIFQVPTLTPNHSSGFPQFCKQCLRGRGSDCTFLFVVGKCGAPQPLGSLVPFFCSYQHEDFIEAHSFVGSMALLIPNLSFQT